MKKLLLLGAIVFSYVIGYNTPINAQVDLYLDDINVYVTAYGRIAIYTLPDTTRQQYRMALLVGTAPNTVFDLEEDVEVEDSTQLLSNPSFADYEIFGSYNNDYSGEPPNVLEKQTVYCWNDLKSIIVKYTVVNRETTPIDAILGLDLIPNLDGSYGYDTVSYSDVNSIIRVSRGGVNLGYKLLSHNLSSVYSFEWYDGYEVDSDYWNWLNYGSIQPEYISNTVEGPVIITSQAPQNLASNDSITIYYAVSVGNNETEMLTEMQAVQLKYNAIVSVESDLNNIPSDFTLDQNYPNPFNPSTKISFGLPQRSSVVLKVFNALGQEVAELVNESLEAGTHSYNFDASKLTSGIYIYSLQTDAGVISKKMTLVK
jgi:hypothetical protein